KTLRLPGGTTQTRTFAYDEADRLTQLVKTGGIPTNPAGTIAFTYDANGNLTSDSSGRQMTWNALDELTALHTPQFSATFAYDPLGRRTAFSKGAISKSYFLNGLDVLSDGSSNFLQGVGVDEHLQVRGLNNLNADYLSDHLGSTTQLIDSANASSKARLDYK